MLVVMIELYGLLPPQALSSLGRSRSGEKIWCEGKKEKKKKRIKSVLILSVTSLYSGSHTSYLLFWHPS